jgi:hypothetical protein
VTGWGGGLASAVAPVAARLGAGGGLAAATTFVSWAGVGVGETIRSAGPMTTPKITAAAATLTAAVAQGIPALGAGRFAEGGICHSFRVRAAHSAHMPSEKDTPLPRHDETPSSRP